MLHGLERLPLATQLALSVALIAVVAGLDYLTGWEVSFSLFYVIPIALLAWVRGWRYGLGASLVSAAAWYVADAAAGHVYSNALVPIWNMLIRLSFFVIITMLLAALRQALEQERELARIDSLTGALNSRVLYQLVHQEVMRLERSGEPFTLAYLDLDNFKPVNDRFGHSVGDQALQRVVDHASARLRKIDVIGRLGGDEFAILFPETGAESAAQVIAKIRESLLEEMRRRGWPITISIGAVTCTRPMAVDDLVKRADELMYQVKRGGRDGVRHATTDD